ncbi:MAG: PorT family protein, partial [Anaerolineales bacterium]|nr:PorT family protein [Anaerolineales bacterium]
MKKLILLAIILLGSLYTWAQQPKMHLKFFGGWNSKALVYRVEGVDSEYLKGWQAGGGFRVMKRKAFLEADITFVNSGITYQLAEEFNIDEPLEVRIRSLQLPLSIGYVPVKKTLIKWFVYGGLVNEFSLMGQYTFEGVTEKFAPGKLRINTYKLGARFGTQLDLGIINVDMSYTIGITNSLQSRMRTNS